MADSQSLVGLNNFESCSPVDEISDNFDISREIIRELLQFAAPQRNLRPNRP